MEVFSHHDATFDAAKLVQNQSRNGRYLSITYTPLINSQMHLDAIYQALNQIVDIKFVI